jgi:hypothetical protein
MIDEIDKDKESPARLAPRFAALCSEKRVNSELTLTIMHGLSELTEAKRMQLDEMEKQAMQQR